MAKLPLLATVGNAYQAVITDTLLLLRFGIVPLVLATSIDLGREIWSTGQGAGLSPAIRAAAETAVWFCGSVVSIPFWVQSLRLFLLGPDAVSSDGYYRVGREAASMFRFYLMIFVLLEGPGVFLIEMEMNGEASWIVVLGAVVLIIYALILTRVAFVWPVICLNGRWNLPQRWRETGGNFWRLFGAFGVALAPVLFISLVFSFIFEGLSEGESGLPAINVTSLTGVAIDMVFDFVLTAIIAAVTVIAYATLTGYQAKGVSVPVSRDQ